MTDLLAYLWLLPVVFPAVGFWFCCCASSACAAVLIDFDDDTYGSLTNTGADPPWELDNTEYPGQVVYTAATNAELLWTKPIVDTGGRSYYHAEADVDSGHGATDNDAGGVTIVGPDWQAWCGVEGGTLVLRFSNDDGDSYETTGNIVITPVRITLTVQTREGCPGYASVFGGSTGGAPLSMTVSHDVEIALPDDIDMGIWVPTAPASGGDSPFPDCCPVGDVCHDTMTATGSFANGLCGCSPSAESTTRSTTDLTCGGTPLSSLLTGFTPADGYYIADLPFDDGLGTWTNWKTLLYCDGTDLHCVVINGSNCPQWTGTLVSSGCDPFTAQFEFSDPDLLFCCMDSIGDAYITWSMSTVDCPVDARAFDNVSLSACGGSTDPLTCDPEPASASCFSCDPFFRCWRVNLEGITPDGINDAACDCRDREYIFDFLSPDTSQSVCNLRPDPSGAWILCDIDNIPGNYKSATFGVAVSGDISKIGVAFVMGFSEDMTLYEMDLSIFDCDGPNVLTLTQVGPGCSNWPATLTIEPWECLVVG